MANSFLNHGVVSDNLGNFQPVFAKTSGCGSFLSNVLVRAKSHNLSNRPATKLKQC
jgi:hypothetical protein